MEQDLQPSQLPLKLRSLVTIGMLLLSTVQTN
jgi:hypothetical protein